MINLPEEHTLVVAIVITELDGNKSIQYLEVLYYADGKWFKRNDYPLDNNTKVISWKYQDEITSIISGQKHNNHSPKYAIEKKFNFAAAHALEHLGQDHPCSAIHGHNYVLTVRIEADQVDDTGFVIDFSVLSKDLKHDIDAIDHSFMITTNTSFKDEIKNISIFKKIFAFPHWFKNTSSEYICRYFHYRVKELLELRKFNYSKIIVKLSETDNNLAEYSE
jgi:6-pyruvoyltetrahydropterin/6-carboxytetrahydropterin synthase